MSKIFREVKVFVVWASDQQIAPRVPVCMGGNPVGKFAWRNPRGCKDKIVTYNRSCPFCLRKLICMTKIGPGHQRKTRGEKLVERLRGGGAFGMGTDEIIALMRGPPADEDAPRR